MWGRCSGRFTSEYGLRFAYTKFRSEIGLHRWVAKCGLAFLSACAHEYVVRWALCPWYTMLAMPWYSRNWRRRTIFLCEYALRCTLYMVMRNCMPLRCANFVRKECIYTIHTYLCDCGVCGFVRVSFARHLYTHEPTPIYHTRVSRFMRRFTIVYNLL